MQMAMFYVDILGSFVVLFRFVSQFYFEHVFIFFSGDHIPHQDYFINFDKTIKPPFISGILFYIYIIFML